MVERPFTTISQKDELVSLYFHIPFCTKKCHYCHFFVLLDKPQLHKQLIDGLKLEIAQWADQLEGKKLASIYFGGGTPSLLEASEIHTLLEEVDRYIPYDPAKTEITLEANPETITHEKMRAFAKAGINRISIGVQTLDDPLLIQLGRTHRANTSINTVKITADAGITNISIDLMYDIPGQTMKSWMNTLEQIGPLPITHLSLYNLTIEPNTVFFKYRESLNKILPDAECSADMYKTAVTMLKDCGLEQYEISAFARDGLHSQHNTGYWTGRPFLGFGPSAFSYWDNKRFRSVAQFKRYLEALQDGKSPIDFSEELEPNKRRNELLAIALRLRSGVDCESFEAEHGRLDPETHLALQSLVDQDLLYKNGNRFSLTDHGVLFYDTIAVEII
ncbi:MAG TPA: radical SAM family heme chaperone HemW [Parachlamydiaceae bacterium]|nr:radical SAM family heme chaperone HemW [Parachlamydiaceae bacterium]